MLPNASILKTSTRLIHLDAEGEKPAMTWLIAYALRMK